MKRIGGLFDAVADARTLACAAWRAAAGKRHRPEVIRFLSHLEPQLAMISQELRLGRFEFGGYRCFPIQDPKSRLIHAPSFRDRVVHHALIAVAGPVLERSRIAHSYACRPGFGQHAALRQLGQWLRPDDWFLKMDVAKYYDSIQHDLLREMLARRFREQRLLQLFDRLLLSYEHSPGFGLPIGALTSQYLGNFYLGVFDHWINQTMGLHRYMRYMDDLLLLGDHKTLRSVHGNAAVVLEGLGLRIKHRGILAPARLGVPYLGFVVYPDRIRLNQQGRRRLRRKLRRLERDWLEGSITDAALQAGGTSLFAHARFGNDVEWRRMVCRGSRIGEAQGPDPRAAGRLLEQLRQELPLGGSQQEQAG